MYVITCRYQITQNSESKASFGQQSKYDPQRGESQNQLITNQIMTNHHKLLIHTELQQLEWQKIPNTASGEVKEVKGLTRIGILSSCVTNKLRKNEEMLCKDNFFREE